MKRILQFVAISVSCILLTLGLSACNKEEVPEVTTIHAWDVGSFVTNVKGEKKMFLTCSITFEVTDATLVPAAGGHAEEGAEDHTYIVKNAVNKVLIQLTEDEVLNNTDLDAIEQRLTDAANEALETNAFVSAKITSFAAQ